VQFYSRLDRTHRIEKAKTEQETFSALWVWSSLPFRSRTGIKISSLAKLEIVRHHCSNNYNIKMKKDRCVNLGWIKRYGR
jgi:hypothetical protein